MKFPSKLEELLPPAAVSKVLEVLSQPTLANTLRETLNKVGLKDAMPVAQVQDAWRQARGWFDSVLDRVLAQNQASPAAINASGHLFDMRWSSLPMDSVVVQALTAAAVNFQNQVQLEQFASRLACEAARAPAALFAVSTSAVLAALANSPAFRGGVVIARTDILRIPGSTDIRGVLAAGANRIIEVGAVNGVTEQEWQSSLTNNQQALVLVSPNSLDSSESRAQRVAAIARARAVHAPVMEIVFDVTRDTQLAEKMGLPLLSTLHATGIDLVIAPLDGLLAGPTGAVVTGSETLVNSVRSYLETQGGLTHGSILAGAAAALGGMSESNSETSPASTVQMLLTNEENLKERARRLAIQLNNTSRISLAEAIAREPRLGPSPWSRYRLPSHAVAITPRDQTAQQLSNDLNSGALGATVWNLIEQERVVLDLRFVEPADDHKLVETLHGAPQPTP